MDPNEQIDLKAHGTHSLLEDEQSESRDLQVENHIDDIIKTRRDCSYLIEVRVTQPFPTPGPRPEQRVL